MFKLDGGNLWLLQNLIFSARALSVIVQKIAPKNVKTTVQDGRPILEQNIKNVNVNLNVKFSHEGIHSTRSSNT